MEIEDGSLKEVLINNEKYIAECIFLLPTSIIGSNTSGNYVEKTDWKKNKKIICRICYGV